MSEKKKRNNRKTVGKILIGAGSLLIIFVIAINVIDLVISANAINEFKSRKAQIVFEKIDDNGNVISKDDLENEAEKSGTDGDLEEDIALCLLRIPKIDLEEAVKEGSTKSVLSSALGHVEDTAFPGENGNCCIAGHRNYVFGKYFNRLEEVTFGDIIEIETMDNTYMYEVDSIEVVEPEDVSVLEYTDGKNLTLITCTPFMIGSHRLIVHATMK